MAWKVQLLSLAVATVRASREGEVVARLSDAPEEDDAAPLAQTPPDVSQLAPYFSQNITFLEAENMTQDGGWEARQWVHGGNYFSSTVNNVFMSLRMFLHAPANASTAKIIVTGRHVELTAPLKEYAVSCSWERSGGAQTCVGERYGV